jgi:hypothetical protein
MPALSSINPQLSQQFADDALNGVTATTPTTPGPWKSVTVHLRTDTVAANKYTDATAFTEATFSGYAPIALDLASGGFLVDPGPNTRAMLDPAIVFEFAHAITPPDVTETITGYWVGVEAGNQILCSELFPVVVPMGSVGDFIQLDLFIPVFLVPLVTG